MAKINNTYNKGYHIAHDFDPLEYEREQKRKRKEEKKSGGGSGQPEVVKQTMDLEFGIRCLKCDYCIPRRKKVYARIKRVEKDKTYDKWIHEFEFHCMQCSENLVLRSDYARRYETNGFICWKNCERLAGGFDEAQAKDAEAAAAAAEKKADEDFDGENKIKQHQDLEARAAELNAFVEKEQNRSLGTVHMAALDLVAKKRDDEEKLKEPQDLVTGETEVPLTEEDEQRFQALRARVLGKAAATATNSVAMEDEEIEEFEIDLSVLDRKKEFVETSTESPAQVAAVQADVAPPTAPPPKKAAKKKRSVLAMFDSDEE